MTVIAVPNPNDESPLRTVAGVRKPRPSLAIPQPESIGRVMEMDGWA
jgi:hypothetical protein